MIDGDSSGLSSHSSSYSDDSESSISLDLTPDKKENPFHNMDIPKIIIQSNSPILSSSPKQEASPAKSSVSQANGAYTRYTPASQPGRTPPGTALYQSLSSQPLASQLDQDFPPRHLTSLAGSESYQGVAANWLSSNRLP